ncbi:MAG TPA: radical SAM protein, partial [Vicinamibacterales bacterium]
PATWPEIEGLAFRKNGQVCATSPRRLIPDLDLLPFPLRDPKAATHRGVGIRSLAASRGCYYDCTFCSIHEFYRRAPGAIRRTRSPENVVQEMERLFCEFGVRIFIFQDDDFFARAPRDRQWAEGFLAALEARKLAGEIVWRVSCRVDDLDARLLGAMKAAGLSGVYVGVESGSERGLETFNKHYAPDDVDAALALLRDVGLPFEFGFMMFEPYSTMESVRQNIDFLKGVCQYGDPLVHFCKMSPYAGTAIARRLAAEGRLEGSIACPDYRFLDPRLDLLQAFYAQTFNFRNFDERGLVERLRFAKFDCGVVERLFAGAYDAKAYREAVSQLIRASNQSAVETMGLAARMIESRDLADIIDHWEVLEDLSREERLVEKRVSVALDRLMVEYGFEASPRADAPLTTCWPPADSAEEYA